MDFLTGFLTIVLVLVSIFMVLLVLMQRGSQNGGLGAAMGGGMAESALGAETSSVLSKWTRNTAIVFFVLVFGLYLGRLWVHEQKLAEAEGGVLPEFATEEPSDASNPVEELISEAEKAATDLESEVADPAEEIPAEAPVETPTAPVE